jgi:hypothetical protein
MNIEHDDGDGASAADPGQVDCLAADRGGVDVGRGLSDCVDRSGEGPQRPGHRHAGGGVSSLDPHGHVLRLRAVLGGDLLGQVRPGGRGVLPDVAAGEAPLDAGDGHRGAGDLPVDRLRRPAHQAVITIRHRHQARNRSPAPCLPEITVLRHYHPPTASKRGHHLYRRL